MEAGTAKVKKVCVGAGGGAAFVLEGEAGRGNEGLKEGTTRLEAGAAKVKKVCGGSAGYGCW